MQGQVVRIVDIVRSRRPIVAVTTSIIRRRRIEVAGVEEVIWVRPEGFRHDRACWGRGRIRSGTTFWTTKSNA